MIYIIWLTLLVLFIFAYISPQIPIWLPIAVYIIVVIIRAKEKIGNYWDWKKKSKRDEDSKLEETLSDLANRGVARGGIRIREERKMKEDFKYERRKRKRQFENELINCLFLQ